MLAVVGEGPQRMKRVDTVFPFPVAGIGIGPHEACPVAAVGRGTSTGNFLTEREVFRPD
jgi:hypothetical protein